jgi:hypothetical protein
MMNMFASYRRWRNDNRGVAAIEFALAVPILLSLFLGSIDILRAMLFHQKVEKIAYAMADLTTQQDQLTRAMMDDYYEAPGKIMEPFTFGSSGLVIITSVYRDVGDPVSGKVRWRDSGGGTLVRTSRIGAVGANAVLPGGLTLNERDNVLIAEVFYGFDQLFPVDFMDIEDIYKAAIYKPRLGSQLSAPQ